MLVQLQTGQPTDSPSPTELQGPLHVIELAAQDSATMRIQSPSENIKLCQQC